MSLGCCLACVVTGAFVFFLRDTNLALLVVSAAIVYFAVFYLIRGFDLEDRATFEDLTRGIVVKIPENRNKVVGNLHHKFINRMQ